jgi:hypothetical protein
VKREKRRVESFVARFCCFPAVSQTKIKTSTAARWMAMRAAAATLMLRGARSLLCWLAGWRFGRLLVRPEVCRRTFEAGHGSATAIGSRRRNSTNSQGHFDLKKNISKFQLQIFGVNQESNFMETSF